MDKTQKFLQRLSQSEQKEISNLIKLILERNISELDVKKLKGYKNVYRVRSGSVRIIFRRLETDISVLEISRRSEKTYRDF